MNEDVKTLRRAAEAMRQRAYAAVSGPWQVGAEADDPTSLTYVYSAELVSRYPDVDPTVARINGDTQIEGMPNGYGINGNADLIASFGPEVADVLAAALDDHSEDHVDDDCRWLDCRLVEFARVYLGEVS